MKMECDYLNGWIKKRSHTQKFHPKVVNPRDIAGERQKKKKKKNCGGSDWGSVVLVWHSSCDLLTLSWKSKGCWATFPLTKCLISCFLSVVQFPYIPQTSRANRWCLPMTVSKGKVSRVFLCVSMVLIGTKVKTKWRYCNPKFPAAIRNVLNLLFVLLCHVGGQGVRNLPSEQQRQASLLPPPPPPVGRVATKVPISESMVWTNVGEESLFSI